MPEACNFIKIDTLAQMFSCEFCEISKNTSFTEHGWVNAFIKYIRLSKPSLFDSESSLYALLKKNVATKQ